MHTPEQANTQWCPMVRASNGEDMPCNAGNSSEYRMSPSSARCIADRCAMWRWEPNTEMTPTAVEGASGMTVRAFKPQQVNSHGYCGLAGGPHRA